MLEEFGINKFHKGKPYGSGLQEHFTLIYTGMGSTLLGDAVMYLKDSPCQNLILFGACQQAKHPLPEQREQCNLCYQFKSGRGKKHKTPGNNGLIVAPVLTDFLQIVAQGAEPR